MMPSVFIALLIFGLASAATQPRLAPVYSRAVDSNPTSSVAANTPESTLPIQQQQPTAEARESPAYIPGEKVGSNAPTGTSQPAQNNASPAAVSQASPYPSYYQLYQMPASQQYPSYPVQQPQYSNNAGVDFWTKYRMNDVMIGAASLALVAAGSYMVLPKLYNTVRGSRELSELKAEDLSRMAKSVFQAVEKFYDMNNVKE